MKIAMRRGHQRTGSDGCASGIVNEITVADDYYKKAMNKFKALGHTILDCTPPEANRSLADSLNYGINKANNWGADIFISCHVNNAYNSYNGSIGCEVIYHRNSSTGKNFAIKIERELANIGFKSRGAKADVRGLAEINNTKMPCVIIEPFFVEATGDVATYKRVGGEGIANCIVKGVTGKTTNTTNPAPTPTNLYRVRKAWSDTKSQVGAYGVLQNAIDECKKHTGYNVFDANGKIVYPTSAPTPTTPTTKTPIQGKSILNVYSLAQYVLKVNPTPKLNCTIDELANYFIEEGDIENIRGDIAFCQAIKETGYFKFGGDMLPEQNNYCGLGTTGGGVKGAYFKSPREGAKAQIQHLKAYSSKEGLKSDCVDPRYNLVTKGIAPNWEDLNNKWAVPGVNYGQDIVKIYNSINKLDGGKKMDIVLFYGEVDKYGAEYIGDFYKLPVLSLKYFNENPKVKENAGTVYLVGGQDEHKPTANTILISGEGRYDTATAVTNYISKLRK